MRKQTTQSYELSKGDYLDILNDSDDGTYNWKKLIDEQNKWEGNEDEW